ELATAHDREVAEDLLGQQAAHLAERAGDVHGDDVGGHDGLDGLVVLHLGEVLAPPGTAVDAGFACSREVVRTTMVSAIARSFGVGGPGRADAASRAGARR